MAQVEIGTLVQQPARRPLGQDGRAAQIAHMVGATRFVEQQVPVDPAGRPAVQVMDDGACVALAQAPLAGVRPALLATLGEEQALVGPGVVQQLHMVEMVFAIPVEAAAPDVTGGFGVRVDDAGPLHHQVAVVVPDDDLDVAQSGARQGRPEVIAHEVALLLRRVDAGVPALHGHGLVLHRHAPDRHPLGRIGLDEAHIAAGPGLGEHRQQPAAAVHLPIALHPGRRTPGRGQQLQRSARHLLGRLDHGQQGLAVAVDIEMRQRHVAGHLGMGIVAQREIAAVHVHAAETVAMTGLAVEVVAQQGRALLGRQRGPGHGRRLGEGRAKTLQGLEAPVAVDHDLRQLAAAGPGGQGQRRLLAEPLGAVACTEDEAQAHRRGQGRRQR
eukprot:Opistho-2@36166